jgi:hypothetical protein
VRSAAGVQQTGGGVARRSRKATRRQDGNRKSWWEPRGSSI